MCIYKRRFIIGISSYGYGGQEVPWSAVCKMENQEGQWCNVVRVQKGCEPQEPMCERKRGWMSQRNQREQIRPSSDFVLLEPSALVNVHHWWGGSLLSLLIQMVISCGETLTDTPRNNGLLALWPSLSMVQLTHKINHLRGEVGFNKSYWNMSIHVKKLVTPNTGSFRKMKPPRVSLSFPGPELSASGYSLPPKCSIFDILNN